MSFRLSPIDQLAKLLAEQTSRDLMLQVLQALEYDIGPMLFRWIIERLVHYLTTRKDEKKKR